MHDVIFKFYTAFCFLEVLNIASGLGFVKENGQIVTYNNERNICIQGCETACDMQTFVRNWNMSTAHWLKYYVYIRWIDSEIKWLPSLITFLVSSIWHGTAFRLWFFYVGGFFLDFTYKNLPLKTMSLPAKAASFLYLHFCLSYIGMVFTWQYWDRVVVMCSAFGHYPTLVIPLVAILSGFLPKESKKEKTK